MTRPNVERSAASLALPLWRFSPNFVSSEVTCDRDVNLGPSVLEKVKMLRPIAMVSLCSLVACTEPQRIHEPPRVHPASKPLTKAEVVAPPDLRGEWSQFRTRIREGWGKSANFAGHYVIITWGCGSGCRVGVVGNHLTGEIFSLGLGGASQMHLEMEYNQESNYILARWDDFETHYCVTQSYIWTGSEFTQSGSQELRKRKSKPCYMIYDDWRLTK